MQPEPPILAAPPTARKRGWRKLLLSSGVLAATLLLGELAARIYIFGAAAFDYEELKHFRTASKAGLYRPSDDPRILFEWRANLRTRSRLTAFETNSLGMRDREYAPEKAAGIVRIAAVGDSFTAGTGVEAEETWSAVLERRLNARAGNATGTGVRRVEVWNWGVSAYHLSQYLATIESKVLASEPDLIVIGYCALNDNGPPPIDEWTFPYRVADERNGFTAFYLHKLLKTWVRLRSVLLPREIPLDDEEREYLEECFTRLGELSRREGLPIVVLFMNIYPVENAAIREMAETAGLLFLDGSRSFEYHRVSDFRVNPIDYHPNAAAHSIFADVLANELSRRGLAELDGVR